MSHKIAIPLSCDENDDMHTTSIECI